MREIHLGYGICSKCGEAGKLVAVFYNDNEARIAFKHSHNKENTYCFMEWEIKIKWVVKHE